MGLPVANRLAGNALSLNGGNFTYKGSGIGNSSETIGALTINGGSAVITITPGTNLAASVTAASIAEAGGGQVLIQGANFGGVGGIGVATFSVTAATPSLHGRRGQTGTTNKGIQPWAVMDNTTTGALSFATQDSFGTGPARRRHLASTGHGRICDLDGQWLCDHGHNNLVFSSPQTCWEPLRITR